MVRPFDRLRTHHADATPIDKGKIIIYYRASHSDTRSFYFHREEAQQWPVYFCFYAY